MPETKCSECGAEIIWIRTPAGVNHPLNAEVTSVWIRDEEIGWTIVQGHIAHFATCKHADAFRKKRTEDS